MTLGPEKQNHLLASLPGDGLSRIRPHLELVQLPVAKRLETPNEHISHVYFPLSGLCSVLASAGDNRIEIGIIGRDGMTGISVVLATDISPHECIVQVAGEAFRITVAELRMVLEVDPGTRKQFLRYARAFMLQTAQTALANGRLTIDKRLVRWLLMARDRLDGDDIPLTHDFLSLMLGVTRPGVTIALQALESGKLIENTRGCITIRDRQKMEAMVGKAYARL